MSDYIEWRYLPQFHDWVSDEHEAPLTGYTLTPELMDIFANHIDTTAE